MAYRCAFSHAETVIFRIVVSDLNSNDRTSRGLFYVEIMFLQTMDYQTGYLPASVQLCGALPAIPARMRCEVAALQLRTGVFKNRKACANDKMT